MEPHPIVQRRRLPREFLRGLGGREVDGHRAGVQPCAAGPHEALVTFAISDPCEPLHLSVKATTRRYANYTRAERGARATASRAERMIGGMRLRVTADAARQRSLREAGASVGGVCATSTAGAEASTRHRSMRFARPKESNSLATENVEPHHLGGAKASNLLEHGVLA